MSNKELLALRFLIDNPKGLYGSEFVQLSEGKITRGTIYTMLERLVEKGFVREIEEPPTQALQMTRTRHRITSEGQRAYNRFLAEQGLSMVPFGNFAPNGS